MQLPAVWVVAAVGAGAVRAAATAGGGGTWALLGVMLFITMFGKALQLAQWVLDLSPFDHLSKLPAAAFTATPLVWLAVLALALATAGLVGCRRRDLISTA